MTIEDYNGTNYYDQLWKSKIILIFTDLPQIKEGTEIGRPLKRIKSSKLARQVKFINHSEKKSK